MVKFQFSYLRAGEEKKKSFSLIKLARSNVFCQCVIEKNVFFFGGGG